MFRRWSRRPAAWILAIVGLSIAPAAQAVPLDAAACEQLQVKMDALRKTGIEADMAHGPAWARTNLTTGRLQLIAEYLEIDEQLNFRCGLAKDRIVLPTTIEGGEEEIPASGDTPKEAPVEGAAGTLPLPQKAPRPPKRAESTKATKPVRPEKKPPKRQAKPKVDDAYRPPAKAGTDG